MTEAENSGRRRRLLRRLVVTGIVLAVWFWTQSLIGSRIAPASGLGDALHNLTAGLHAYLSVTYHVANDFFFSGHTAIAVFRAIELSRLRGNGLTVLAVIVIFEVTTVLILRAHYTMDVFTGVVAALWVANFSERVAPRIDQLIVGGK